MRAGSPARVFLHRVRRLQGLPLTGEVSVSRMQQVLQSFPAQAVAGRLSRPQDVPRLCAGSVAIQMHGLRGEQTSLGIQPLAEKPGNGFPHPLQELRDVQGMQPHVHRPQNDGAGPEDVFGVLRSDITKAVWYMPPVPDETPLSRLAMEVVALDERIAQLDLEMPSVPHLPDMQRAEGRPRLCGGSQ